MCSHRSAWLTHNENYRTEKRKYLQQKTFCFPAGALPQMLSKLLFAKCKNMNLLVIDLLLSHKAQIFGNWAKKKRDFHHQNKQHAEPGFVKCFFFFFPSVAISVSMKQISRDFCRWLQTMSLVHVQLEKKKKKMWEKEGKWAQNQHGSCLNVFSPSEKPQIWDAVTGRQRVQRCQFGRQSSAAAKRCC